MNLTAVQIGHIKQAFSQMKSKEDLLSLLNYTKTIVYGENAVPFKIKHINYHSYPTLKTNRYIQFSVRKKSGGDRIIHAPNKGLKSIQKCLNLIFQTVYTVSSSANGFVPGRSIVDNARIHEGNRYIYNIDLKDFFPSIEAGRVWSRLQHPPFNLNEKTGRKELANTITWLCCHELEVERYQNGSWVKEIRSVLPQGAPTSPTLSNIICQRLDFYLNAVAKQFGLKYSRYADDITFSSLHNVYSPDSLIVNKLGNNFVKEINRIIEAEKFHIKASKTRLQKEGYRQEVTGLIVNEKVNVQKRYIKQLRMWLYYWESYGYARAYGYFFQQYQAEKGHFKKGKPNMSNVIGGKLDYLRMVKGGDSELYSKLKSRYDQLVSKINEPKEIDVLENNYHIGDLILPVTNYNANENLEANGDEKLLINIKPIIPISKIITLKKEIIINKGQLVPFEKLVDNNEDATLVIGLANFPIIHKPQELVSILKKFSVNNSALKYSTHSWDAGKDDEKYIDLEDFISKANLEFNQVNKSLKELNKQLWAKILSFLFNKNVKKKRLGYSSC